MAENAGNFLSVFKGHSEANSIHSQTLSSAERVAALFLFSVVDRGAALGRTLPRPDGTRCRLGSALAAALVLVVPNLCIVVLVDMGVGLTSILLVVPGGMLLCRWIVALPANIAERTGVLGALGRSRDLTDGHRWRVFAALMVLGVAAVVAPLVTLFQDPQASLADKEAMAVIVVVVGAAVSMMGQVGLAALYLDLVDARRGTTPAEVADAFA